MSVTNKPAIILVAPQLGDNIGMVARAMLNFGLTDLRLVKPKAGWDVQRAVKAAAGADDIIENRREFSDTATALADLHYIIAMTARPRDMVKTVFTPEKAMAEIHSHAEQGRQCGLLYGPERSGLHNDDIARSDAICTIPANADFSSLNLAQAVLLSGYIWHRHISNPPDSHMTMPDTRPATHGELEDMFRHLEAALDHAGFLAPPEKKPAMARNIRNMLLRAAMTEQDVRTFRGMINALLRWPRDADDSRKRRHVLAISRGEPASSAIPGGWSEDGAKGRPKDRPQGKEEDEERGRADGKAEGKEEGILPGDVAER